MGEATVEFKFSPGDIVKTKLGEDGIVDSCNVELNDTKRYYVVGTKSSNWFQAEQLTLVE